MKKTPKRVIVAILSAVMALTSVTAVGISAAGAASNETAVAAAAEEQTAGAGDEKPTSETDATQKPAESETPTTAVAPTIGKIDRIDKNNYDKDRIDLTWTPVSGVTGYTVYYMNKDRDKSWTFYGNVTKAAVSIKNLLHTTPYDVKIVPYVIQNSKRYNGPEKIKMTATNPPFVGGRTRLASSNYIKFSWTQNVRADGYKIYRKYYKTNGSFVLYKTIKGNRNNSFTDKNVELNRGYYYIIRAYRTVNGNNTYHSPESEIRMFTGLNAPSVTSSSQLSTVTLKWNTIKYATAYDVYYSTSKNGTYSKLASTAYTTYTSNKLTADKTYYFKVIPYKLHGSRDNKIWGDYTIKAQKVSNRKYMYGKPVGDTYVLISISQQHLWFYKNGKLVVETDVVTGNAGSMDTPKGYFTMYQRARNTYLSGPGYSSFVSYWMAFSGGCGIHDSSWRSSYGGNIYKGNGSHGCVNTPYSAVKKIYDNTTYNTPVIVY